MDTGKGLPGGYAGRILRVDLSAGNITIEDIDINILEQYLGGTGVGVKLLYDRLPADADWDSSENMVMLMTGPLTGSPIPGTGLFSIVTKGAMTNLAASTQANGFLGAFLKSNRFDGLCIEGISDHWVYLSIEADNIRLCDAFDLVGKDTMETEDIVKKRLINPQSSVYSIGPAGEHLVKFAALVGDKGHVAAHNGVGAVLGAKRLKAIAVARGQYKPSYYNEAGLKTIGREMLHYAKTFDNGTRSTYGTSGNLANLHRTGMLPVKNYTTSIWPHYQEITGQSIRSKYKHSPKACWACALHCRTIQITEGKYQGFTGEEPEYEVIAALGPLIGNTDVDAIIIINNLIDRLGMNANEAGWVLGWAIECYETGLLTKDDTDGLELTWGNMDAVIKLLQKIALRQGFGNLLAEGVRNAAQKLGGQAEEIGIYTLQGNVPRGHDHRARWTELLDTCLSNTGTIETTGGPFNVTNIGFKPIKDNFSTEVAIQNARTNGRKVFDDCSTICRFIAEDFNLSVKAVNYAAGWDLSVSDALKIGQRVVNHLRVFNLRHGLNIEKERPSKRYGSMPVDGPAAGVSIIPIYDEMRACYWEEMGWCRNTGKPLPKTLCGLGLELLIPDIWET